MSEEQGAELVMPFVTVASKGGPHDDVSYTAGWEMGALDITLAQASEATVSMRLVIHTENTPQADLVAMKHGFKATVTACEDSPEWSVLELRKDWSS